MRYEPIPNPVGPMKCIRYDHRMAMDVLNFTYMYNDNCQLFSQYQPLMST